MLLPTIPIFLSGSPIITKSLKPQSSKLIDLLGMSSTLAISLNEDVCRSQRALCVLCEHYAPVIK